VLPYWLFAVDTIAHAARKLTVLAPGGRDTPAARRALRREMADLKARFIRLWLARNRRSEIAITLANYNQAIRTMHRTTDISSPVLWRSPFVTTWQVSRLAPKTGPSVAAAPPVSLRDRLRWRPLVLNPIEAGTGFMNVHDRFGDADGWAYLATRLYAARGGRWTLRVGHDGGIRVFVDGKAVFCQPRRVNPARPDRSETLLTLAKGEHELVIALDLDHGLGWGIFVRFEIPPDERRRSWKGRFPKPAVLISKS
jgi:hypothetical protein